MPTWCVTVCEAPGMPDSRYYFEAAEQPTEQQFADWYRRTKGYWRLTEEQADKQGARGADRHTLTSYPGAVRISAIKIETLA